MAKGERWLTFCENVIKLIVRYRKVSLSHAGEGGTLVLNLATTTAEWKIESPSEWLTIKVESSDGSPHGSLEVVLKQ